MTKNKHIEYQCANNTGPLAYMEHKLNFTPFSLPTKHLESQDLEFQRWNTFYSFCKKHHKEISKLFLENVIDTVHYYIDLSKRKIQKKESQHYFLEIQIEEFYCKFFLINEMTAFFQKWTFILSDQTIEHFTLSNSKIISSKYFLMPYLKGDELEKVRIRRPAENMEKNYWDNWKSNDKNAANIYRHLLYPILNESVIKIRDIFNKKIKILDLGGGDGELTLKYLAYQSFVKTVYVMDSNEKQISQLKMKIDDNCSFHPMQIKKKIFPILGDLTRLKEIDLLKEKQFEIIILCGVVARQVLSKQNSMELLQKCKNFLVKQGFILITSFSPPHFQKQDYEEMGFHVHNCSYPWIKKSKRKDNMINKEMKFQPFYVLSIL